MEKELNVYGLIAMILALAGLLVLPGLLGTAGIVLGILGCVLAGEDKGKGMAITGIVVGAVDILVSLVLLMALV